MSTLRSLAIKHLTGLSSARARAFVATLSRRRDLGLPNAERELPEPLLDWMCRNDLTLPTLGQPGAQAFATLLGQYLERTRDEQMALLALGALIEADALVETSAVAGCYVLSTGVHTIDVVEQQYLGVGAIQDPESGLWDVHRGQYLVARSVDHDDAIGVLRHIAGALNHVPTCAFHSCSS